MAKTKRLKYRPCSRRAVLLGLILLVSGSFGDQLVTVGIYDSPPLVYKTTHNRVEGLFIDILHYVAQQAGWNLVFAPGRPEDLMERLDKGELDLLVAVPSTPENASRFALTEQSVLSDWGQLYTRRRAGIRTVQDLDGATVAVKKQDPYYQDLQHMLERFNIECRFVELADYRTVLEEISSGQLKVGLVSRLYGVQNEKKFRVKRSAIVCSPVEIHIATAREGRVDLLRILDNHLSSLKTYRSSLYYEAQNKWLGQTVSDVSGNHTVRWIFLFSLLVCGLFVIGNMALRSQVNARTEALRKEIYERKLMERGLRESEERFRLLAENAKDLIFRISLKDGSFEYISPACKAITGYDPPELKAMPLQLNPILPTAWKQHIVGEKETVLAKELPESFEFEITTKEGRRLWINQRNTLITNGAGAPAALEGVITDVTHRRKTEDRLQRTVEIEGLISKVWAYFAALPIERSDEGLLYALQTVGEYARSDRTYVALFSGDGSTFSKVYEWCEKGIQKQWPHMQAVVTEDHGWLMNQMRDFATVYIEKTASLPPEADAEKKLLIQQGVQSMLTVPMVWGGTLVGFVAFDSVRKIRNWSDEERHLLFMMGEVIATQLNRVYMHRSLTDQKARTRRTEVERDRLATVVEQAGDAIVITDRNGFIQYVNRAYEKLAGQNIEQLKGHRADFLSAESESPYTAEIWKTLAAGKVWHGHRCPISGDNAEKEKEWVIVPVRDSDGQVVNFVSMERVPAAGRSAQSGMDGVNVALGRDKTVLLAEDDAAVRVLIERILKSMSFHVLAAANGEDALQAAAQHRGRIHLLVTDIMMPGINGFELAKQFSATNRTAGVIYISGYPEGELAACGLKKMPSPLVSKPFLPAELEKTIESVLRNSTT